MKITLTGIAVLTLLSQVVAQSEYPVSDIPVALKSRADAVVRQETIVADMLAPTKVRYEVKQAITVFNKEGEDKARLVIYYNKQTVIKRISGRVFDAGGFQIGKFTQRDFKDESAVNNFSLYEDTRVKYFLPAVTAYPYTVEYAYELELKQNLIIPAWRPDAYWNVAVQYSEYTFTCGESDDIRVNDTNYAGEPVRSNGDGRKSITWNVANLPARRYEPYSPDPETYKITVKVAPVNFSYYKHEGHYSNWEELGKWSYDALLADGLELPEATTQVVRKLVEGLASDKEKAKVLYEYLQRKTRYVSVQIGIGGFKPMAAKEVDRLGYGDCKGLVNYMQALLKVAGIPSYYCIVEAGSAKRNIQSDFASMEQGNHIILCVPLENDTTWLECTSQRLPFGYLGSFTDDRTVWACTPTGGQLLRTPNYPVAASTQHRQAVLVLAEDGTLTGKMETAFAAGQYENHLEIAGSNGAEQIKLLKKAYDVDYIDFRNIDYQKQSGKIPMLVETFEVTLPKYAPENGGQVFLTANIVNRQPNVPAVKDRKLPVYINRGYTDEDQITYVLPDGLNLVSGGWKEEIESRFGKYQATVEQMGNQLRYHRKFVLNEGTFPAEQYTEFSAFINRINMLDNRKAILAN
ncbi:DUF3857 domain-containing transglutaminase family protein [Parapedobacter defluvii]|uniref:DUF3857 domain-containing transglutaminase family protein n=1 Tax=Parapedobacter defluvii TaxID=2045106 RepID=UPI003341FAA2